MSHVVTVDVLVKDLRALSGACARLGFEFIEGQQTYRWNGTWVDDSPVPDGLFDADETERVRKLPRRERCKVMEAALGRCAHAIRVPGAGLGFEVGVVSSGDGFRLVWDFIDGGLTHKLGGNKALKLRQAYSVQAVKLAARNMAAVRERVLPSGEVQLMFEAR